ncbi:arylsulfatase [Marinomonas sp. M1K-6]|uniref:Arylsulfatase n=1 Tax=Marinomonas profundi TaxID=2726122 RepID=A0A847R4L2_9GAMM|nr:arylsulfatase [Marinomonas profundi]NLQ18932.1 arylsulfatase [Marinomonas profundi]UDV02328.1 arylsulfatase [Marinomonas profundi]
MINRFYDRGASTLLKFQIPHLRLGLVAVSLLSTSVAIQAEAVPSSSERPNILLIMADDLGYSDLSAFGSEINTPNIDGLATQGRILTNFHTAAVCSPTRASLMTGVDHHLAGIGNMGEVVGLNIIQNKPTNAPWGKSNTYDFDSIPEGYRGHLSEKTAAMPELLSDAGYHTYMVGKWHLAYDIKAPDKDHRAFYRINKSALPYARGFDKSFTLVNGGASHFAPSTPPTPLDMVMYADNDRLMPAEALPTDFFSTTFYTDKLIEYIDSNHDDGKPFFAYAAYTAPHWPLQAPEADIAVHKGRYDEGYGAIMARRIERMKSLGIVPDNAAPAVEIGGDKAWQALTPEERKKEAKTMELYAAMVTNLDHHVGRLVSHLKQIGEYDNTVIMFMSDNGAEGASAFAPPIPGTKVDNAYDNMGKPGSVVAYGAKWAEVSTSAFSYFKGFTGAEGGTASPLIVKLNGQEVAKPMSAARLQVTDVLPTLLDMAGAALPGDTFKGKSIHVPQGVSFLPALKNDGEVFRVHPKGTVFVDELMGASYVVRDNWKLTQQNPLAEKRSLTKDVPFRLYDLSTDRSESIDVAVQHPEIVAELKAELLKYFSKNSVVEHATSYTGR